MDWKYAYIFTPQTMLGTHLRVFTSTLKKYVCQDEMSMCQKEYLIYKN